MSTLGRRIDPSESLARLKGKPCEAGSSDPPGKNSSAAGKADAISSVQQFEARRPLYHLEDVVLPDSTRRQIKVLQSRIANHDILYKDWELEKIDPHGRHVAVSFYGPPGTGKTMVAEALAAELGKPIIDVSYAEIESKYVGDTGKNIVAAFKAAGDTGAALFFDEADSILGKRMTNVTQAADHGVNVARAVMLKQLDAFNGIVFFATNLAKNFDGAFVRRILQHVEIPLPDTSGRMRLWQGMIRPPVPGRGELEWGALAEASEGLAGGDIKNAVVICLAEVVSRQGDGRRVRQEDLMRAIEDVRRAKRDVGRYSYAREEEVPPARLSFRPDG